MLLRPCVLVWVVLAACFCQPGVAAERQSRAVADLFDEAVLADNTQRVRERTAALPDAERFEALVRWVLPSESHATIRTQGLFSQTDPPPAAAITPEHAIRSEHSIAAEHPVPAKFGAGFYSPVFDLLNTARRLDRLQDLLSRIQNLPPSDDEEQRRSRAALLTLVHLELGQTQAADAAVQELQTLVSQATPDGQHSMWPETLVAWRGTRRFPQNTAVRDLVGWLFSQRTLRQVPPRAFAWHTCIMTLNAYQYRLATGHEMTPLQTHLNGSDWIPVTRSRAVSRGPGAAQAVWMQNGPDSVEHLAGHQEEFLFYRVPLRGDFQIEGEILANGSTEVFVAGQFFGPEGVSPLIETGTFRNGGTRRPLEPAMDWTTTWARFRVVCRDRVCSVYFHGRLFAEFGLAEHHDPWFGIRSWWRARARFRRITVTGNPQIPNEVIMSAAPDLASWLPYQNQSVGFSGAVWRYQPDPQSTGQIVSDHRPSMQGTAQESLLRYHRPLTQRGAVEYDFYYEEGIAAAHPALDRLAVLLHPDGAKIHWVTDDRYDRTGLPPDNIFDEPQHRRGPAELPLKQADWNHLRLSVESRTVSVELNGQLVFQRPIDDGNRRTFGLYHDLGKERLQVRNVVMTGDWPTTLPAISDQSLADQLVLQLDQQAAALPVVFEHDFATDGLDPAFFRVSEQHARYVQPTPEGLRCRYTAAGRWSSAELIARLQLYGDFDIEAEFDQLVLTGDKTATVYVNAALADERRLIARCMRIKEHNGRQLLSASLSEMRNGTRIYGGDERTTSEAVSGRLRLARRNDTIYYLFAQSDSSAWQLFSERQVSDQQTVADGVTLRCLCDGLATADIVWKKLRLSAERIRHTPPKPTETERSLHVMSLKEGADSETWDSVAGIRHVIDPINGLTHLGSAEWSADGRFLVCDMSMGGTNTSRIVMLQPDGSDARDLGPGCMPSLSPDNKQLVFSQPGAGIVRMNVDGTGREQLDARGWGTQWSPDGRYIAWGDRSRNITLLDTQTGRRRALLTPAQQAQVGQIYWNLGWSQDSRSIGFKSLAAGTNEQV
ncbi:MAG: DUF1583 domain-containing protein, partial [Fuerstiella sp.]